MTDEQIFTIWRFGYIRLFDNMGYLDEEDVVTINDHEWRKVLGRFYWRVS